MEQLEKFFTGKGIKKTVAEFNQTQENQIQCIIEKIVKPVFNVLISEFNSYSNIKANSISFKKTMKEVHENTEQRVYKSINARFLYRPKFVLIDEVIVITGQYSISDLYGERTEFKNTGLKKPLSEVTREDIKNDIIEVFIEHGNLQ